MNLIKSLFGSTPSLNTTEAQTNLKDYFVLDVRQAEEFAAGHIQGATLIPLSQLGQQINRLPKNKPILCVCRSGARSGRAVHQLTQLGYQAVNLQGGMMAWQRAGMSIKKGKA